jgi:uncharacterized Zn-binding protein involved in type VI secretion
MGEFNAARELDDISHTSSKGWMIAGLIGGAILGAAAVIVTGGTALIAVSAAAAGASAAGGLGEVLGSMSWAPRHTSGKLTSGSPNVFINDRPAIRAHLSSGECNEHSGTKQLVAEGSSRVFINDWPAARTGDRLTCSSEISSGSHNVFIGGSKIQTDEINPEVPGWVNWLMLGVGAAALGVLASPAIAILSTLGALGGGYAGNYLGGKLFGDNSDGQKWSMLLGSLIGGAAGGKGGAKFDGWRSELPFKAEMQVETETPRMSLADAVGKEQAESWIKAGKENTLMNAPKYLEVLSDDQIGALYGYTTNEGYNAVNPVLRGGGELTPELEAFAGHATDGLSSLPKYVNVTSRGIDSLPESILNEYQTGNVISDGAFMSTSSKDPFGGNIQIEVKGTSGKDISFLSAYSNEAEVLYPPGTKFEVIERIEQNGKIRLKYEERP